VSTARRRTIRTRNQFPFQLLHVIPEQIAVHEGLREFTLQKKLTQKAYQPLNK